MKIQKHTTLEWLNTVYFVFNYDIILSYYQLNSQFYERKTIYFLLTWMVCLVGLPGDDRGRNAFSFTRQPDTTFSRHLLILGECRDCGWY